MKEYSEDMKHIDTGSVLSLGEGLVRCATVTSPQNRNSIQTMYRVHLLMAVTILSIVIVPLSVHASSGPHQSIKSLHAFLKCSLCQSVEVKGQVTDCQANHDAVAVAARDFYVPRLRDLTSRWADQYVIKTITLTRCH